MKNRRVLQIVFILLVCLTAIQSVSAQPESTDNPQSPAITDEPAVTTDKSEDNSTPEQDKDLKKSPGYKQFLIDTGIHYGFMWAGRLFYVRLKHNRIFDASFSNFIDNFKNAPEWDDGDGFATNLVYHPLFGAEYYLFYRARGHSMLASAAGSFIQSLLFEYSVEGLVERPSAKDLIFTPGVGVPLGIGLENLSEWLINKDNSVAKVAAYIVNPTRMFIQDRKFGLFNPVTGTFAYQGHFTVNPSKAEAIKLAYPFFFESPLPLGGFSFNFEVINLEKSFDNGQFIFYSIRFDFPSVNDSYSIYFEVPYGGVNHVSVNGEDIGDGFEFGNILLGGKFVLISSDDWVLSGGLDFVAPTAFKDNRDRLETIINFTRDMPFYLAGASTVTPYVSAAAIKGPFSLQGNIGLDSMLNAGKFEGNAYEARLKYATAVGVNPDLPLSPLLFLEVDGYTFLTASDEKSTDIFVTPGLKFGKKYGSGIGLQIPLVGRSSDIAKASVVASFQLRF